MDATAGPTASAERAIALVRALGTLAEGDRDYIAFARNATLAHGAVRRLAGAVSPQGLRPLTRAGSLCLDRARGALEDVLDFSRPLRPALANVEGALDEVDRLVEGSRAALATLDGPMPDLLSGEEAEAFAAYQGRRLSALCYFGSLLYGSDRVVALRDVRLDADDPERSHAALLAALERLARDLASATRRGAWLLEPIVHASCPCVPALRGYLLHWTSDRDYRDALRAEGLRELNPGLAVGWRDGRPRYRGLGYLVGTTPERSFALRSPGVHTRLPVDAFGRGRRRLERPLELIAEHFGGDDAFCVDPRNFAAALDRHVRCSEVGVS